MRWTLWKVAEATTPQQKHLYCSHQDNLSNGAWGFALEFLGTQKCLSVIKLYFLVLTSVKSDVGPHFIFVHQRLWDMELALPLPGFGELLKLLYSAFYD